MVGERGKRGETRIGQVEKEVDKRQRKEWPVQVDHRQSE